jgi:hypothetical protein
MTSRRPGSKKRPTSRSADARPRAARRWRSESGVKRIPLFKAGAASCRRLPTKLASRRAGSLVRCWRRSSAAKAGGRIKTRLGPRQVFALTSARSALTRVAPTRPNASARFRQGIRRPEPGQRASVPTRRRQSRRQGCRYCRRPWDRTDNRVRGYRFASHRFVIEMR